MVGVSAALVILAVYLLPTVLIAAWIAADRWLDRRWEVEHNPLLDRMPRPWDDDPTPTYDAVCFERWERELRR